MFATLQHCRYEGITFNALTDISCSKCVHLSYFILRH